MKIRILGDAALSLLKSNIEKNKFRYLSNEEWIDEYFKENNMTNYYTEYNIQVEDF